MNNKRRKEISKIVSTLEDVRDRLSEVVDEEQCAFDNMPESIQYSERGYNMQEAIDNLDDAIGNIVDSIDNLYEAIE